MPNMDQVTSEVMPEASAPAPESPASTETSDSGYELPDEVLKIPAISALMTGSPPATYAAQGSKSPELSVLEKNLDTLKQAGFGLYRTKDKENFVLFNNLVLTPEEVKKADAEGNLDSIAVPFEELNTAMSAGFKGSEEESAPSATPAPAGNPPSAAAQKKTQNQRLKNVQPGSPTEGARPGQGRILNNIAKSVV